MYELINASICIYSFYIAWLIFAEVAYNQQKHAPGRRLLFLVYRRHFSSPKKKVAHWLKHKKTRVLSGVNPAASLNDLHGARGSYFKTATSCLIGKGGVIEAITQDNPCLQLERMNPPTSWHDLRHRAQLTLITHRAAA